MDLAFVLQRMARGSPLLVRAALAHAALAGLAVALMPFDDREILGLDPWVKPFKFMASIAIFEATLAWMLDGWRRGRLERLVEVGVVATMAGETVCLWLQSARGTTSHFNTSSVFDGAVFGAMGLLIAVNSLLVALLLVRSLRPGDDVRFGRATLQGVRAGLATFLLGSAQGLALIANDAHAIGVPDGGPGLPLVNWSTEGGDLRIAHALGLHGLQLFPMLGAWLDARRRSAAWLLPALALFLALTGAAHVQALRGEPLFRQDVASTRDLTPR